jgi:transaldolase
MTSGINELKVKIFADGADLNDISEMYGNPLIKGLTTNPTLMRKAGVTSYEKFAHDVLRIVKHKPISFEVFSDDLDEMEKQARHISDWAENVYVKIPITNSKGLSTSGLVRKLVEKKVKINVTAIMTIEQVKLVCQSLNPEVPNYISIFAGRIADTGRDPIQIMKEAIQVLNPIKSSELIWASPRELLNIMQASQIGCNIITATTDILRKLDLVGYDLNEYSLDTVKMFYKDALASNFKIDS